MSPVSVVLADDHAAVREGLRVLLAGAEGIEVVGESPDGEGAVRLAASRRPDVVLMDVQMPGLGGIEATRRIVAEGTARVLVLTTFGVDAFVDEALEAGAAGFLLKTVSSASLAEAIRSVAAGDAVLAPEVTRGVLERRAPASRDAIPDAVRAQLEALTPREREVLACLGEGLRNADIAARLYISETTAKTHVSRLLAKLGVASRVQAALLAQNL